MTVELKASAFNFEEELEREVEVNEEGTCENYRGTAERRRNTRRKLNKRKKMMKDLGLQGGTLYEKHVKKVEKSAGYMRKGHVSHFVQCGFNEKTRDRNRYGKSENWKHAEKQRIDSMDNQMLDLREGKDGVKENETWRNE